jgi:geranylgeranyl diphosphate synthase type II
MNSTQLLTKINDYLGALGYPETPTLLYRPIEYTLEAGGKRLRPVFVLMSYGLFADDYSVALPCAAAVEVFHNFTLLHDDIMDNAPLRRGRPTVWNRWGENVAILSGDAMIISSYSLLAKAPSHLLQRIMECFNRVAMQVCEGQQYDMDFESRDTVELDEYINMIALKTSVLFEGAIEIGAILGGANDHNINCLKEFALEFGLAFQLQDDLLDSFGDERLGKKIGGDILEGKKTYLMIMAMSHANEEQREVLRTTHLRSDLSDDEKIATIKALYESLNIRSLTEQQITLRINRALSILETVSVEPSRTEQMRRYVESLVGRNY